MSNDERMAAESTTHSGEKHSFSFCELVRQDGELWNRRLTLSGGAEGTGGGETMTVVVTVVVVVEGTVTTLVNGTETTLVNGTETTLVSVMGGFPPPGVSGELLSLCWEPMNRPMKTEQSRRKIRSRMNNILLRGVSGS